MSRKLGETSDHTHCLSTLSSILSYILCTAGMEDFNIILEDCFDDALSSERHRVSPFVSASELVFPKQHKLSLSLSRKRKAPLSDIGN